MTLKKAKGKKDDAVISCVGWLDLLGYGSMLRSAGFDPRNQLAERAVERLRLFHSTLALHALRSFQMLIMNDGAAAFDDLSPRSRVVSFRSLRDCINLYKHVNEVDQGQGFPGARMVIATGFRMTVNDRSRQGRTAGEMLREPKLVSILNRLQESKIECVQAVNEAFRFRPRVGSIEELQANFAFTKAYLADKSGSRSGLGGASCFIDLKLFSTDLPDWITFDELIDWTTEGMNTTFGKLKRLNISGARRVRFLGILDADEIATRLTEEGLERPG